MDYMAIITDGLAEPDLIRHLQREQRKAADQYYTPEEFYDGCRRAVDELEADYIDELRLYTYLQDDNPDKDIPEPRLSLMKYTGGRLWQSLTIGNINFIRSCVDEAERLTSTTAPTPEPVTATAIAVNPYPRIFKTVEGWQLFEEFQSSVRERYQLADYSFIYWKLKDDGFIYENIGPKEYKDWLDETFDVYLGEGWKQYDVCRTHAKDLIYNHAKQRIKLK
ncbi:MAG: hypothetical protein GXY59_07185 [Bacteroidales bacterium]|nr:hypothetical protein [Bacteroidales bacterium]